MKLFKKHMTYLMTSALIASTFFSTVPCFAASTATVGSKISWNFEKDLGNWTPRGDSAPNLVTNDKHAGSKSALVTGRTQDWQGAQIDLTNSVVAGGKYKFDSWVKYDKSKKATEKFILTLQIETDEGTQYNWVANGDFASGKWHHLSGEYTLPSKFSKVYLYIQTQESTIDFYMDDITMETLEVPTINVQKDIPSLKDVYAKNFKIGAALASHNLNEYEKELVNKHFNSITCENAMKPDSMLDYEATIAYMKANKGDQTHPQVHLTKDARAILDFARDNKIPVRGHVLTWHTQQPVWMFTENYSNSLEPDTPLVSKEVMLERLNNYIDAVFKLLSEEYPDVDFYAFDVVNEAINSNNPDGFRDPANAATGNGQATAEGENEPSLWITTIGPDYIKEAFKAARAATKKYGFEKTKLAYNDYNECSTKKSDFMYKICKDLYDEGLLDVVGMQGHYNMTSPTASQFEDAIRKYASIGKNVEIQITELDIPQEDASKDGLIKQAYRYKTYFDVMKKLDDEGAANITSCTLWGVKDDESWRSEGNPLLFDANYLAKPAFWGITDATKLPVLSQEVKAYSTENSNYTKAFTIQNGTAIKTASGNEIAKFKAAWDEKNVYINVLPTTKGSTGTVKVFIGEQTTSAKLTDNTVITIPLSAISESSNLAFDLFIEANGEKATWNDVNYTDAAEPNQANFGKLMITKAPNYAKAQKGTPTIDGKVDDSWTNAQVMDIAQFSVGNNGAVGTAKALWDDKYIYLLIEVKDSLLTKASADAHQQDSVEIFIDENNAKTTSYEVGDVQYRVNFDNERSINGVDDVNSFITATSLIDGGYIIEAAIPSRLGGFSEGQVIGFDLQINDDADANGTRDHVANWNDLTGNGWSSTSNYGVLELGK